MLMSPLKCGFSVFFEITKPHHNSVIFTNTQKDKTVKDPGLAKDL